MTKTQFNQSLGSQKASEVLEDPYRKYLLDKQKLINEISGGDINKLKVTEQIIRTKLDRIFEAKKNATKKEDRYFSYNDILKIPEVQKYFNVILVISPRAIGKTYSANQIIKEDYIKKGKKFVKIRLTGEQAKDQANSDNNSFLREMGYEANSKGSVLNIETGEYAGHYIGLSTSASQKSLDFQNPDLLFLEEFMIEGAARQVKDKTSKLIRLLSTIQRHNPNCILLGASNYGSNSNDELLREFAGYQGDSTESVHFNWALGAILVTIKAGIYYTFDSDTKNIAHRAALASDNFNLYHQEYSDGWFEEKVYNLMTPEDRIHLEKQRGDTIFQKMVICIGLDKTSWYTLSWDLVKKRIYVEQFIATIHRDLPKYTMKSIVIAEHKTVKWLHVETLRPLIAAWQSNLMFATNPQVKLAMSSFWSSCADILRKSH